MPQHFVPASMPWYKSKVIIGAAVAVIANLAVHFGLVAAMTPADQQQIVDLLVTILGAAGGVTAIGARLAQKSAPKISGS